MDQGHDLQKNVLQQSYDYLTITPKLEPTYDDVQFTEHLTKDARLFLGTIPLQNRNSVRKLAYDIPKRNLSGL